MFQTNVCQGALCQCDQGSIPSALQVTSQAALRICGAPVATVQDCQPGANLGPFGLCQILTARASGSPIPCTPSLAGPWRPGSDSQTLDGVLLLVHSDQCSCTVGGRITLLEAANRLEQFQA